MFSEESAFPLYDEEYQSIIPIIGSKKHRYKKVNICIQWLTLQAEATMLKRNETLIRIILVDI